MKTCHAVTASSVVLTLMLATPAAVAEQRPAQPATGTQSGMQSSGMLSQSVDISDIEGKQLVDASNRTLGKIDDIVQDKDGNKHHAVVSIADEDKKITIPLDQLEMRGDTFTASQASSKDELESLSAYDEDEYKQVTDGQQIDRSEFSAFEPQGETGQSSPQQGSPMPQGRTMQQDSDMPQEGSPSGSRY